MLQRKRRKDALKLQALCAQIRVGLQALKRGEFTEVSEKDLDDYLERLGATSEISEEDD